MGIENIPEKGGVLFIANHLSYADPFFLGGGIFRNIRFLTTADVFKKKLNRFFFHQMGSIPIKRFTKDPSGIRKFFKLMHEGYAVGYFAEGQRSWTGEPSEFPDGVIRLLQKVPVPIIPVSIAGIYALWPRWADNIRRARVQVRFHPPIQNIKKLSPQKFEQNLKNTIHSDEQTFKNKILSDKRINSGLTNLFWRCPICGDIDAMREYEDDKIKCCSCRATGQITKDNHLEINNLKESFGYWYHRLQNFSIEQERYKSHETELYLGNFPHIKKMDQGTLVIEKSKFIYNGKKQYEYLFSDIKQLYAEGGKTLHFITENTQVQIKFKNESPLKWVNFYRTMLTRSQNINSEMKDL
ncbi:MAG: 1-acyl-sn-glycerol-3-phosphate acyltransferase [Candidatus Marinimicrobia bacterium]|nr:1-acyl-sn-glycerol-3-phosphate acyltransferase [Candidatus Neomarinimicrobiota bacterium]